MGEAGDGSAWRVSVDSSLLKRWHHGHVTLHVDPQQRMADGPQLLLHYDDADAAAEAALPTQLHVRVRSCVSSVSTVALVRVRTARG